jgi:hypothetical protein
MAAVVVGSMVGGISVTQRPIAGTPDRPWRLSTSGSTDLHASSEAYVSAIRISLHCCGSVEHARRISIAVPLMSGHHHRQEGPGGPKSEDRYQKPLRLVDGIVFMVGGIVHL